jgi:hypothetical protein
VTPAPTQPPTAHLISQCDLVMVVAQLALGLLLLCATVRSARSSRLDGRPAYVMLLLAASTTAVLLLGAEPVAELSARRAFARTHGVDKSGTAGAIDFEERSNRCAEKEHLGAARNSEMAPAAARRRELGAGRPRLGAVGTAVPAPAHKSDDAPPPPPQEPHITLDVSTSGAPAIHPHTLAYIHATSSSGHESVVVYYDTPSGNLTLASCRHLRLGSTGAPPPTACLARGAWHTVHLATIYDQFFVALDVALLAMGRNVIITHPCIFSIYNH